MTQFIKKGTEFRHGDDFYKVTEVLEDGKFLAIYIGSQERRYMTTYNGYVKHGDFRSDNSLFQMKIEKVQEATGVIGLNEATQEYKEAIGLGNGYKILG